MPSHSDDPSNLFWKAWRRNQYLPENMKWIFGNMGSIASQQKTLNGVWNFETKKPRNQATKKLWNVETKKFWNQETKKPRNQETSNLWNFFHLRESPPPQNIPPPLRQPREEGRLEDRGQKPSDWKVSRLKKESDCKLWYQSLLAGIHPKQAPTPAWRILRSRNLGA